MSNNADDLFSGLKDFIGGVVREEMKKKKKAQKKVYTAGDETPEFIEFWQIWLPYARQTDGRGLARECFLKLVANGADPAAIVDGTRYFFRTMKESGKEFVPLSATWLNRGAYEDLAVQERAYQKRISKVNVVSMPAQSANYGRPEPVSIQEPETPEQIARRQEMARRLRETAAALRATH